MAPPIKPSKTRATKIKKQGLAKIFDCINCTCGSQNSVTVSLDRKVGIAELVCKVCDERFSTTIHRLSEEIDVYGAWIDEKERSKGEVSPGPNGQTPVAPKNPAQTNGPNK